MLEHWRTGVKEMRPWMLLWNFTWGISLAEIHSCMYQSLRATFASHADLYLLFDFLKAFKQTYFIARICASCLTWSISRSDLLIVRFKLLHHHGISRRAAPFAVIKCSCARIRFCHVIEQHASYRGSVLFTAIRQVRSYSSSCRISTSLNGRLGRCDDCQRGDCKGDLFSILNARKVVISWKSITNGD